MDKRSEFWVVSVPRDAAPGASLRLLDVRSGEQAAKEAVENLPSDVIGIVAVLSRVVMFNREMAVTTKQTNAPVKGVATEEDGE